MSIACAPAAVAALVLALPQGAQALGCYPLTPAGAISRDYQEAAAAPQPFIILRGTVDHSVDYRSTEEAFRFEAGFEGWQVLNGAQSESFVTTVIIDGQCVNGDCGYLGAPGTEQYFLAAFDDGGYRIGVYPCAAFPAPVNEATTAAVTACVSGQCPEITEIEF